MSHAGFWEYRVPYGTVSAKALRQAEAYLEYLRNHQSVRIHGGKRESMEELRGLGGGRGRGGAGRPEQRVLLYSERDKKPLLTFEVRYRRNDLISKGSSWWWMETTLYRSKGEAGRPFRKLLQYPR